MQQMTTGAEPRFTFRPGESVSGDVFLKGESLVKGPDYGLDEERRKAVSPELNLIASFPLKDKSGKNTTGARQRLNCGRVECSECAIGGGGAP